MPATLADLEARVAALEAERADYRAVLTAVNALGENQREHSAQLADTSARVRGIADRLDDTNTRARSIEDRVHSIEDNVAEVKDLLVRALDR